MPPKMKHNAMSKASGEVDEIITAGVHQYRLAGWMQRGMACMVDLGLIVVASGLGGDVLGGLIVLAGIGYWFIGSGLMDGASVGKRVMGLRVIDARHGGPCSVLQDLHRHRYLLNINPVFIALRAYDAAQGHLELPETYVVKAAPLTAAEKDVGSEAIREKPAKLDLSGMGETLRKMRESRESRSRDME